LRFDDRLETALRHNNDEHSSAPILWMQLIDILAQNPKNFNPVDIATGLKQARKLVPQTNVVDRLQTVKSLAGRIRSAPLVQLLAADVPTVAAATISGAQLADSEWALLIPQLPMRARGFLRNRSDLGPETRRALAIWSPADFVLPNPDANESLSQTDIVRNDIDGHHTTQISEIVERIERLRRTRALTDAPIAPIHEAEETLTFERVDEIRFETNDVGSIIWVEGAPRGALIGVGISEPAFEEGPGPDAYGAAAFRQRMPLENARMRLCGGLIVSGDWRINAAPFFDPVSGRFQGYRGLFRRPTLAENPQIEIRETQKNDQLQQLVHELRTPLGAIIGFSEIIEQQLFGPVSSEYRALAHNILNDAERLLAGFDDLAMAAKIESGRFVADQGITECGWLAIRLADRLHGLSETLSVTLNLAKADPVRPFATASELTERLFSRLLSAVIIGCEPGEELNGRFRTELSNAPVNRFILSLPRKLAAFSEEEMLGSTPLMQDEIEDAPLLGLGFSLRLVRNLARSVQGDLRFYNDSLILTLPAVQEANLHIRGEERD
jgi:His Kinase A (phospho-acceptor) domain